MFRSWTQLALLAAESQRVIWLRSMRLAQGGAKAEREATLMVAEKVAAAGEEGVRMMLGATTDSMIKRYRKRVRANVRRLGR